MLERLAFEALHREERLAFVLADFVDRANIRMVECGSGLRFALKTLERARIPSQVFRKEFQRDEAVQAGVFGFVDHTHPAAAKPLDDAVVGNGPPDQ